MRVACRAHHQQPELRCVVPPGWLLCKFARLDFAVVRGGQPDPAARAELLLLSPSFLVPRLHHDGLRSGTRWRSVSTCTSCCRTVRLLPEEPMVEGPVPVGVWRGPFGFANLRSALPMNIRAHHPGYPVWAGAQADIDRIETSGASASPHPAAHSCSETQAHHRRRHVRTRSAPGCGPTTSSWALRATTMSSRSWPCPRWWSGRRCGAPGARRGRRTRDGVLSRAGQRRRDASPADRFQSLARMKMRTIG